MPERVAAETPLEAVRVVGDGVEGAGLLYDHDEILAAALASVREKNERYPDPRGFLDRPFTLSELREVHEAVLGEPLPRDTFRRRMEPMLKPVEGAVAMPAGVGRRGQVYVVDDRQRGNPKYALPRKR